MSSLVSSSLRRSKRLAVMDKEDSVITKSRSNKVPSSKKKNLSASTNRISKSAPIRTRGRSVGKGKGGGRARRKESQVVAKVREDAGGGMILHTYVLQHGARRPAAVYRASVQ